MTSQPDLADRLRFLLETVALEAPAAVPLLAAFVEACRAYATARHLV